jgi:hypothetical protein
MSRERGTRVPGDRLWLRLSEASVYELLNLGLAHANVVPQGHAAKFDPGEYMEYVEDFELSEEQKIELLKTLWEITAAFARWGYGIDSVQFLTAALEATDERKEPEE